MAGHQATSSDSSVQVQYRDIAGFSNYRVGDDGSVWSRRFDGSFRKMVLVSTPNGYLRVTLCPGRRDASIHRLVLEAFVGPCPDGMQACHFPDPNKNNNALSNLRWATLKDNQADRLIHGTKCRGQKHYLAKFTEDQIRSIRKRCAEGHRGIQAEIAVEYGVTFHTINKIVKLKNWAHVI